MVALEIFLLDVILRYAFGGKGASALKWGYYGIQFFLLLTLTMGTTKTAAQIYLFCLFPMMQMVAFTNMSAHALNASIHLDFSNMTTPIIGSATMLNITLLVLA